MSRDFTARPPGFGLMPLSIGLMGPPGGGKTKSALRIARGMQRVRPGPIVVIDTENKRAEKYGDPTRGPDPIEFLHVDFKPPFVPHDFLDAIRAQLPLNPAAIIVDSLSDEHEGEGGYLDWHDAEVPKSGGNEWAAWKRPSASRKKLVAGFQQITVPLIFTFRAREKTKQVGKKVEKIGYVPVAPAEILHALDLTCLLPLQAKGRAVWNSAKEGEDFVLKFPEFLARYIREGEILNEDLGEELARWAMGTAAPPRPGEKRTRTLEEMVDSYIARVSSFATADELRDFQLDPATVKFMDGMRGKDRPDLMARITDANQRRAADLLPPVDDDEEPDQAAPATDNSLWPAASDDVEDEDENPFDNEDSDQ